MTDTKLSELLEEKSSIEISVMKEPVMKEPVIAVESKEEEKMEAEMAEGRTITMEEIIGREKRVKKVCVVITSQRCRH